MNLSLRPLYKKVSLALVLLIILSLLIQNSFKTWLSYSYAQGPQPEGLRRASEVDPKNPDYYFLTGYYLMEYDYLSSQDQVFEDYKKALTLSPFNYNYWFFLAEFFYQKGELEKSLYSMNKATSLSPGSVSLRWKSGMLASKLGNKEAVISNLSSVIENDPDRRTKAFGILWQSVGDGDLIMDSVSENALPSYFLYLRITNRVDEAGAVYAKLKHLNYDTSPIAHKYTGDLIRKGEIDKAIEVWSDNYGGWDGVWNGSFDQDMLRDGFGWKLRNIEGTVIKRDMDSYKGKYALKVDFDGEHNVNFRHLSQVIPVREGEDYTLELFVKSEDVLTLEDLYWEVYCLHTRGLVARSESIFGTYDWKPLTITFKAPDGCSAINLRLKREKSESKNNLISGTLWVDEVSIKRGL